MTRLRRVAVIAILVIETLSALPVGAQDRSTPEAHELARLILSSGLFDVVVAQSGGVATGPVIIAIQDRLRRPLSTDERSQLRNVVTQALKDTLPWDAWEGVYADLYSKNASAAEIAELLAFYKTPLGRRALSLSVILATQAAEAGGALAKSHEKEFITRFMDVFGKTMPGLKAELDRSEPTR